MLLYAGVVPTALTSDQLEGLGAVLPAGYPGVASFLIVTERKGGGRRKPKRFGRRLRPRHLPWYRAGAL